MAYIVNKFSGVQLIVLQDGTIDTSTSLGLVGRNYVGYGETQNENFVFLLENFANASAPSRPLTGQIWFNTTDDTAYAYDGAQWNPIGSATVSVAAPANTNAGALWLKTPVNQLHVYTGSEWRFVGPESAAGFLSTRARSTVLDDNTGNARPVVMLETNGTVFAICTAAAFVINVNDSVLGFSNSLQAGINLSSGTVINGSVTGNSATADQLSTARLINGVPFNGTSPITVKASTTNALVKGTYILGADFDGAVSRTWSVDATASNVIGKVVARNSEGGFSAGVITADFVGNLSGNVTVNTGVSTFSVVQASSFVGATLSGNAGTATRLATARTVNGVAFDGSANVTVTAAAGTVTGVQLNPTVTLSSLTQVGTLSALNVDNSGVFVGSGSQLRLFVDSGTPTIRSATGRLNFDMGGSGPDVNFVDATTSLSLAGPNAPAILGDNTTNLGITGYRFNSVYANNFLGNATTATLSAASNNIVGGGLGAIAVQQAVGLTGFLGLGADNSVLRARPGGPAWEPLTLEQLNKGSFINMINTATSGSVNLFNSSVPVTLSVDATAANTASKVVARDASGNFAAGTITANFTGAVTGTVSGNAGSATVLQTARNINGVAFNGSADITISAVDATKVSLAGSSMTGYLTLVGAPVNANHAATKTYVDGRLPQYTIVSGAQYTTGFSNQVGSFNDAANFFDVFPPAGKSMANIVAFIPSIHVIHYAGGVDGNDSMRCTYSYLGDRIRVYVQNTEQRSFPAANYLAIWS